MVLTVQYETKFQRLWKRSGGSNVDIFLPLLTLLGAFVAAGLTVAWYGSGLQGIDVATRVSARFSAFVFAIALAMRAGPSSAAWMRAFVITHSVHYATLSYQAVTDVQSRLHILDVWDGLAIVFGILLLLPLAFATPDSRTIWRWLNPVAVTLVWATFVGGAAVNAARYWTALIPVIPLLAGLAIHVGRSTQRIAAPTW